MPVFNNSELKIDFCTTICEWEAAYKLAVSAFSESNKEVNKHFKKFMWGEFDRDNRNVIIARFQNKVSAVVRIHPVELKLDHVLLKAAGISSVAVAKNLRGLGLGRAIMQATLSHLDKNQYQLAYLVARRSVDHFYPKFGFIGASSYHRITINNFRFINAKKEIKLEPLTPNNVEIYRKSYENTYSKIPGYVVRGDLFWGNLPDIIKLNEIQFFEIVYQRTLGYVCILNDEIIELSFSNERLSNRDMQNVLYNLNRVGISLKSMVLSHLHPIINALDELDVTFTSRRCLYGGHMVRFLNRDDMTKLISLPPRQPNSAQHSFNLNVLDQIFI